MLISTAKLMQMPTALVDPRVHHVVDPHAETRGVGDGQRDKGGQGRGLETTGRH